MSKPLVLVTGATGHIGFGVLALLLKRGYSARVASRKLATGQKLRELPSISPHADSVSFIEIPDFLAPHAFDEAVKDVAYIAHLASPIPDVSRAEANFSAQRDFIDPAVQGTLGLLQAATASPSVRRIVITSSVAILDRQPREGETKIGPDDLAPLLDTSELESTNDARLAYAESKRQAHAAAQRFLAEHKPHYEVVHVLPGFVQGRNETVSSAQELRERISSNTVLVNYVLGVRSGTPMPTNLVLLDDVAAVHVAALASPNIVDGERFIATYPEQIPWEAFDPIVAKHFPTELAHGVLQLGGVQPGWGLPLDPSKTTLKLDVKFHGPEDIVKSVVGQLVELMSSEGEI